MLTHLQPQPRAATRVVLLGRSGFLARHLLRRLGEEGTPCLAVGRPEIDLTQPEAAERLAAQLLSTDTVVMLSALTPEYGRNHPAFLQNVRMAETVIGALGRARCAHFIYLSSDAVYDAHQVPLDEESSREPMDLYALAHTAREMMLEDCLRQQGIPCCLLRPTSIYGPGDTHRNYGPNRFVRTAVGEGKITLYGRGEERRSHIYIDDAIALVLAVIRHRSTGVLNLAGRPTLSYLAVAEIVQRLSPRPVQLEFAPRQLPTVHRPYKPTQIFRFLYNMGRPIGPIVHRPFVVSAITRAFPGFQWTAPDEAIARFLRDCADPRPAGSMPAP